MGEINQSFMAAWREAGSFVLDSVTADYTGHPCSYPSQIGLWDEGTIQRRREISLLTKYSI